jgi:hypothetical protein
MSDDGVSSPPPDDFAEAPQVQLPGTAAGSVASAPPTRPPGGAFRKRPAKRKPAKPGKKKNAPTANKRPAPKRRPAPKKTGKKKAAKGRRKKR